VSLPFDMPYTWKVQVGANVLNSGQASTSLPDFLFCTWSADYQYPNGPYNVTLTIDPSIHQPVSDSAPVEVANFHFLEISSRFNPVLNQVAVVEVDVPFECNMTVDIYRVADSAKPEQPLLVRRMVERQHCQPGELRLLWDGGDASGELCGDYFYAVQLSVYQGDTLLGTLGDPSRSFYDQPGANYGVSHPTADPPGAFSPFEQSGVLFTYTVLHTVLITFAVDKDEYWCDRVRVLERELHVNKTYVQNWDCTDSGEVFEGANMSMAYINLKGIDGPTHDNNLIALYGTIPRIESARLDAPVFSPHDLIDGQGGVALRYTLDQATDVTIELLSLPRNTVIETWALPGQTAGAQEFVWNGLTPAGLGVAPGDYLWRITAMANGHSSRPATVLMRIAY